MDELRPHNVIYEEAQFATPEGYTKAMTGIYDLVAEWTFPPVGGMAYTDMLVYLSDAKGNTMKSLDDQINEKTDAFDYVNSGSRDFSYSYHFWRGSYNIMLHINKLLANVEEGESNETILQAKAEALFMRALTYFNLVRLYGKPYDQNPQQSLGVMLVLTDDVGSSFAPERASVAEVYAQIVADLEAAIPLFSQQKTNSYASEQAAYALLSRVYLYMGGTSEFPTFK